MRKTTHLLFCSNIRFIMLSMKKTIITDNIFYNVKNTSLALGFFDGVHNGHQKVLTDTISLAKKLGTKSVVVTFKNHPVELLYGVVPEFITTPEERIELFKQLGFDVVIMAEFTKEIAEMTAEQYFKQIILNFAPKSISIGYNHKFGAKQSGDIGFLEKKAKYNDFILNVSSPVKDKNEVTSSTLIRNLIKDGDMQKTQQLLKKPYFIRNIVVKGMQRGRLIDFPTANLEFPNNKVVPKFGVYSGNVFWNNQKFKAIANVGLRPTFNDIEQPLLEIYIFDFDKNIYGENIEFEFLNKIRDEIKFKNIDALKEQIKKDIKLA